MTLRDVLKKIYKGVVFNSLIFIIALLFACKPPLNQSDEIPGPDGGFLCDSSYWRVINDNSELAIFKDSADILIPASQTARLNRDFHCVFSMPKTSRDALRQINFDIKLPVISESLESQEAGVKFCMKTMSNYIILRLRAGGDKIFFGLERRDTAITNYLSSYSFERTECPEWLSVHVRFSQNAATWNISQLFDETVPVSPPLYVNSRALAFYARPGISTEIKNISISYFSSAQRTEITNNIDLHRADVRALTKSPRGIEVISINPFYTSNSMEN